MSERFFLDYAGQKISYKKYKTKKGKEKEAERILKKLKKDGIKSDIYLHDFMIIEDMEKKTFKKKNTDHIYFKGKKYTFNSDLRKGIPELAKKLKISVKDARKLYKNPDAIYYAKVEKKYKKRKFKKTVKYFEDGKYRKKHVYKTTEHDGEEVLRFRLSDPPLLLRKFGLARTTAKDILTGKGKKGVKFVPSLGKTEKVNITASVIFGATVSDEDITRELYVNGYVAGEDFITWAREALWQECKDKYSEIIDELKTPEAQDEFKDKYFKEKNIKIKSIEQQQTLTLDKMELRGAKHLNITSLFNEKIDLNDVSDETCVPTYLMKRYPTIAKKKILRLGPVYTIAKIKVFCENYNIKMVAYDIQGKIIETFYPEKKNKSYKNMIFIAYNNHLYGLNNVILTKTTPKFSEIELVEDPNKKIIELLEKEQIPRKISLRKGEIGSFISNGVQYINNPDYKICLEILEGFGLKDKMTPNTTLLNVGNILEKLYLKENMASFFPITYNKGGFSYKNSNISGPFKTVDKNKCYPYSLYSLEYLLKCDFRSGRMENIPKKMKVSSLTDHYLYLVDPEKSSILLPNKGIYTGAFLKKCKLEGLNFEILEGLQTIKTKNYYKAMVRDVFGRVPEKYAKTILNIMIGKFQKNPASYTFDVVDKIANEDEIKTEHNNPMRIGESEYFLMTKPNQSFNLYNKKPIAYQILDNARLIIYEKMKELKLTMGDIREIHTDSITFKDKGQKVNKINDTFTGWKYLDKIYPDDKEEALEDLDFETPSPMKQELSFQNVHLPKTNSIIVSCYAGCGKTYNILNEVIPKTDKSFIVLTPSHSALMEYRENKVNCSVIQTYEFQRRIPKEEKVIVDEVGMVSKYGWDVIIKCALAGKDLYTAGDFGQLLPVGEKNPFDNPIFLNAFFEENKDNFNNYRNDFTKEYYDSLKNGKNKYLIEQVKKYSTKKPEEADVIICYRNNSNNNTCKKYNDLMMKYHKKKDMFSPGVPLICKTNDLRAFEIYNKFPVKLGPFDEESDAYYIKEYNCYLSKKQIRENFKIGYARTIYSIQGLGTKSFFYAPEDYYFLDGRTAYTVISRLKTK